MSELANHYRQRTIALLAMQYDPQGAEALFAYAEAADRTFLADYVQHHAAEASAAQPVSYLQQLASLRVAEDVVLLSEIHPAWLNNVLEREAPRVVALVMRCLPARHVRYLMDHLPRAVTAQLPCLLDTFAVAPEMLHFVRRRFEARFVPVRPTPPPSAMTFADLVHLRGEELETLLHDLGIDELALAFHDLDRMAMHVVLNRLAFVDAKQLKERLEQLAGVDSLLLRDAQQSLFAIGIASSAAAVLQEIGVHALARAFAHMSTDAVCVLRQKLAPRLGYLFSRCCAMAGKQVHTAVVSLRRARVLARVEVLSIRGAIDPKWKHGHPGPGSVPIGDAVSHHNALGFSRTMVTS
ncbi:MAG: hypothetical protein HY543_02005 [Deltaproteobacteria bacterium]|nr:hypothetical protein [Deltaproteobacteria bacterium]